jgi:hypothetical protein
MTGRRLDLVFLWHMHQPDYRDHADGTRMGEFVLPWVLLHAIKDYVDMAGHLERHPKVRAVVNFVPVLLDQIEDYCDQIDSGNYRDSLLRLLAQPDLDRIDAEDRRLLLEACFRSQHETMLAPFPHYLRLHNLHRHITKEGAAGLAFLSGAYYADLVTWYFLAWSGETERRRQPLLADLMTKGELYSHADRLQLLDWIGQTLKGIVPRYRALMERGQIELPPRPTPTWSLLLVSPPRESLPNAPAADRRLPRRTVAPRHHLEKPTAATRAASARRRPACGRPKAPYRRRWPRCSPSTAAAGWPAAKAYSRTVCAPPASPSNAPPTGRGNSRASTASPCSSATSASPT